MASTASAARPAEPPIAHYASAVAVEIFGLERVT
jgi:hypothetical protein